ncbi:hypothetical protein [Meiothermus sp.]|uniref:hypothetical protein n=1 Tax=Meiothermus sp. TaxID=1955249 RepID=UPI00307E7E41
MAKSGVLIAAEVTPHSGQTQQAARALQELGFRVLHIGSTVSVQAPQTLWRETFGVRFTRQNKIVLKETGLSRAYPAPRPETLQIPPALESCIASIAFVEPPELFS